MIPASQMLQLQSRTAIIATGRSIQLDNRGGKTNKFRFIVEKAFKNRSVPYLILAPYNKDCEVIAGMNSEIGKQFGEGSTRSYDDTMNVVVMTYNSFGNRYYCDEVRSYKGSC